MPGDEECGEGRGNGNAMAPNHPSDLDIVDLTARESSARLIMSPPEAWAGESNQKRGMAMGGSHLGTRQQKAHDWRNKEQPSLSPAVSVFARRWMDTASTDEYRGRLCMEGANVWIGPGALRDSPNAKA